MFCQNFCLTGGKGNYVVFIIRNRPEDSGRTPKILSPQAALEQPGRGFKRRRSSLILPCVPGADDKAEVVVRFLGTTRQTRHRQRRGDWLLERRSLAKDERSGVSRPNPRRQAFN